MSAQKAMPEKLKMYACGEGLERKPKRNWLKIIFGSFKSDLTLESWSELESKRGSYQRDPVDHSSNNQWRF